MPIYDYTCTSPKCVHTFEKMHSVAVWEEDKVKCPKCGKKAISHISASSFRLRGEGFHANDYPTYK